MRKILFVIRQGKIGGGETHLLDLVKNLDTAFYKPYVLSFTEGEMINELQRLQIDVTVIPCSKAFDFSVFKNISEHVKELGINIIHAHGSRACSNVLFASRNNRIPLVYTVHGWSFHNDQYYIIKKLRVWSESLLCKKADVVINVGENDKTLGFQNIKGFKSVLITNGVDCEKFKKHTIRKSQNLSVFGINDEDFVVATIVRLTKQKDPLTFIRAASEVIKVNNSIKFLVIGDGDLMNECTSLTRELQLETNVFFTGYRTDVSQLLSLVDIYCLPSLWEGLPIGIMEAMASEVPVIASNISANKEIISDKENGLLFECQNPKDLSEKILHLIESKNLRASLSKNGRRLIIKKYSLNKMVEETHDVYKTI